MKSNNGPDLDQIPTTKVLAFYFRMLEVQEQHVQAIIDATEKSVAPDIYHLDAYDNVRVRIHTKMTKLLDQAMFSEGDYLGAIEHFISSVDVPAEVLRVKLEFEGMLVTRPTASDPLGIRGGIGM